MPDVICPFWHASTPSFPANCASPCLLIWGMEWATAGTPNGASSWYNIELGGLTSDGASSCHNIQLGRSTRFTRSKRTEESGGAVMHMAKLFSFSLIVSRSKAVAILATASPCAFLLHFASNPWASVRVSCDAMEPSTDGFARQASQRLGPDAGWHACEVGIAAAQCPKSRRAETCGQVRRLVLQALQVPVSSKENGPVLPRMATEPIRLQSAAGQLIF
eukprot:3668638-Amphidinium_carterae.2